MIDPAPNVSWTNRVSRRSNAAEPNALRGTAPRNAGRAAECDRTRSKGTGVGRTRAIVILAIGICGAQGCAVLSKGTDSTTPIAPAEAKASAAGNASAISDDHDPNKYKHNNKLADKNKLKAKSDGKPASTSADCALKSAAVDPKSVQTVVKSEAKSAARAGAKHDPDVKKTQTRGESNRVVSPEDSDSTSPPDDVDPFLFPRLKKLIREDETEKRPDPKVNIRHPDPDTANFPNSAYTIPKGRIYIESSPLGITGPAQGSKNSTYNWDYLIRYGLTDNLELRFFGNGLTAISGKNGTTGFAPLDFDFKIHFWNENRKYFIPAAGLEVYLQTNFGSPALDSGVQPSINMLFDQTLPFEVNLEWNIGITGNRARGNIFYEFSTQWSFEHKVIKDLDIFVQGFYNAASLPRFVGLNVVQQNAIVNGVGLIKTVNDQFAIFGSYNIGCTKHSPNHIILLGFAVAF